MILHKAATSSKDNTVAAAPLRILVLLPVLDGNVLSKRKNMFDLFLRELFAALYGRVMRGEWEVDFLTFQSVAALRQELNTHSYHVMYLWGCGRLSGERAFWAFQNEATTEPVWLDVNVWISLLQEADGNWRIPFVITSFFPEMATSRSADFEAITHLLHRAGVPAIISTGQIKSCRSAIRFVNTCLQELYAGKPLKKAFRVAQTSLKRSEPSDVVPALAASHSGGPVLLQNEAPETLPIYWRKKRAAILKDGPVVFHARSRAAVPVSNLGWDLAPVMAHELRDAVYSLEVKNPVHIVGCPELTEELAGVLLKNFLQNHPEAIAFCFKESERSISDILDTLKNCLIEMGECKVVRIAEGIHNYLKQFIYLTSQLVYRRPVIFVFQNLDLMSPERGRRRLSGDNTPPFLELVHHLIRSCMAPCIVTTRPNGFAISGAARIMVKQGDFSQFLKYYLMLKGPRQLECRTPQSELWSNSRLSITRLERIFTACRGNPQTALAVIFGTARVPALAAQIENEESVPGGADPQKEVQVQASAPSALLDELLVALSPQEQALLGILSEFRVPVSVNAILQQFSPGQEAKEFASLLDDQLHRLAEYNLVRRELDRSINEYLYSLRPVFRKAVKNLCVKLAVLPFSHEAAGQYFYEHYETFKLPFTNVLEAYYHFAAAGNSKMATLAGGKIIQYLLKSEQYAPAEKYIRELISGRPKDNDYLTLLYYLGLAQYKSGQLHKSQKILKLGLRLAEKIPNFNIAMKLLYCLGEISLEQDNRAEAEEFFQKCLRLAHRGTGEDSTAAINYQLAKIEFKRGNSGLALKILDQCLEGAQQHHRDELIHKICQQVGEICLTLGLWDKSLQYYLNSMVLSQKSQNLPQYVCDLLKVGNLYTLMSQDKKAIEFYQKALVLAQGMGDFDLQCKVLGHLTELSERRNEFQLVVQYLTQLVQNYHHLGNPLAEGRTLLRLAKKLLKLRQNENALTVLLKSKKVLEKYPSATETSEACYLMGKLYKLQHQYEEAKTVLKACAHFAHRQGNYTRVALAICELSKVLYDQGRIRAAVTLLKEGVRLNRKHKDVLGEAIQLLNLAKIYGANGNRDPKTVRACYFRAKKLSRRLKSPKWQSEIQQFSAGNRTKSH